MLTQGQGYRRLSPHRHFGLLRQFHELVDKGQYEAIEITRVMSSNGIAVRSPPRADETMPDTAMAEPVLLQLEYMVIRTGNKDPRLLDPHISPKVFLLSPYPCGDLGKS